MAAFLLLLQVTFFAGKLLAVDAQVVYVDPKLRFLVIDKGVHKDLAAGSHICLLNDAGFIVTCSGIVLANKSKAGLRFPESEMKKLKVGSKVRLKTVYLKAEGPRNLRSAAPKFYQAKVSPDKIPKSIVSDAVKAEKMLAMKKIEPKPLTPPAPPPDTPGPVGSAVAAGAGDGAGEKTAGQGDEASGEPLETDLESGEEVTHEVGKPYPKDVTADVNPAAVEGQPAKNGDEQKKDETAATEDKEDKKTDEADADGKPKETVIDDLAAFFTRKIPIKFFRYEVMSLRPVFSHIKYNYVDFATISPDSTQRNSLWRDSETKEIPASGFGVQLKIFGRGTWVYNAGWRYWNFDNYRSVQRLDQSFSELVADTRIRVDSTAAWGELGKRHQLIGPLGYYYGGGLDVDISEIKFQSVRRVDDGIERTDALAAQEGIIGFARSGLTILSFRSTGSLEFTMFNIGTSLTGTMILPFYASRRAFEAEVSVPANVQLSKDGEDDLQKAIGHDKGKFGLELSLGFFFHM